MKTRWVVKYKRRLFNGEERWVQIGVAFLENTGHISLILESLPVGKWDGSLMMFKAAEEG